MLNFELSASPIVNFELSIVNYQLSIINYQLPRTAESFHQNIFPLHHSVVDVAHPQRLRHDEDNANQQDDEVGYRVAQEELQHADEHNRQEERQHLHNHLIIIVFHTAFADEFRVQRHGLLVIDGHLEEDEILESSRENGVGDEH